MPEEERDRGGHKPKRGRFLAFLTSASTLGASLFEDLFGNGGRQESPAVAEEFSQVPEEDTGVLEGQPIETEDDREVARRRKRGTPLVLLAFLAGIAGGVAFLYMYWTEGSNLLLGLMLAICLAGFGCVLILYAQYMLRHELVVASREELDSSAEDGKKFFESYSAATRKVQRRGLLKWMGAGAAGLFAVMFISLFRSLARTPPVEILFGAVWKRGDRLFTEDGKVVTVDSLAQGGTVTVFPEHSLGSEHAQTVVVRVDPALLQLPRDRANWAPQGYLAYSRVCTHAGCVVGLFEANANLLLCPCHQSTFDVLRGAVPTGGPAARALPQLPLYVDSDGTLRAAGELSSQPGPGFTGLPL